MHGLLYHNKCSWLTTAECRWTTSLPALWKQILWSCVKMEDMTWTKLIFVSLVYTCSITAQLWVTCMNLFFARQCSSLDLAKSHDGHTSFLHNMKTIFHYTFLSSKFKVLSTVNTASQTLICNLYKGDVSFPYTFSDTFLVWSP